MFRRLLLWIAMNLQQYNCKCRKPQSITSVVVATVTTASELQIGFCSCACTVENSLQSTVAYDSYAIIWVVSSNLSNVLLTGALGRQLVVYCTITHSLTGHTHWYCGHFSMTWKPLLFPLKLDVLSGGRYTVRFDNHSS